MISDVIATTVAIFSSSYEYFEKAFKVVEPFWVVIITFFSYILFPQAYYIQAATALGITMAIDVITKYIAISVKNGGFYNAIKIGKLTSDSLWRGTIKKAVGYFILMILAGLSIRISPLGQVAVLFSSFIYSITWLRECHSVLENMIEAGWDVKWLLFWVKKKEKEVLRKELDDKKETKEQN